MSNMGGTPTAIRKFVTFESGTFDKAPSPSTINPCCQCEDAAAWLLAAVHGLEGFVFGGLGQEDFGWTFDATAADAKFRFLVVVQTFDEPDQPVDEEYGVAVHRVSSEGFLKRLFGGKRKGDAESPGHLESELALCRAIDSALRSHPSIRNIGWWRDGFAVGSPADRPDA